MKGEMSATWFREREKEKDGVMDSVKLLGNSQVSTHIKVCSAG